MPRYLALEWDTHEARAAVAATRGDAVVIEHAFAVPLPVDGDTGELIAAAIDARRLGRVQALVAVGRASIELKQLSLPPSPDDELPNLVRFQALQEFNSLDENWPLDFIPFAGLEDAPRQVLAAAMSPELVEQIRQTCKRAHLTPERLVLRPCAAASLLGRSGGSTTERVRLLVDVLTDEADLTVLDDDQVVFLRTARMPADVLTGCEAYRPLLGEIRRTVAAAHNQLGGQKVEAIHLCGSGPSHVELAAHIAEGTGLATHLFDPFQGLTLAPELATAMPEATGRFAPLLGMLVDEACHARHDIDFLNPRRPPAPPSARRKLVLGGSAAAAVAALGVWWVTSGLAGLDGEIGELAGRSKSLDPKVADAKELERTAQTIEAWAKQDVNWLDELRELATDLPKPQDVLLTRLSMSVAPDGGKIDIEGLMRETSTAGLFESSLRDDYHHVQGRGSMTQDAAQQGYRWKFASTVTAAPQSPEDYRKRGKPVAATPAGGAGLFGGQGDGDFGEGGFNEGGGNRGPR
jgi:Tfp pilus assembly PilM family ATPase